MNTFRTPVPITAVIDVSAGDITIVASDRTDTVVRVEPTDAHKPADVKAADQSTVDFADGTLTVKSSKQWTLQSIFGNSGSIDVVVELPTASRVDGTLSLGSFRGRGSLGDCKLKTSLGGVSLEQADSVDIDTSMGDVTVRHASGRADVTTGTGAIRLGTVDGVGVIRNSNGDTVIDVASDDIRVNAANGTITIGTARGDLHAKSANGGIRVADVVEGSVVLETAMGELEVGVHEGTAAWLDAHTQFGRVDSALDASDGPDSSGKVVEIRGRTAMGDIVVHRSTVTTGQGRN